MPPALFQDELFAAPPGIVDAMTFMAEAPAEKRGAVHTRPEVAEFILGLIDWPGSTPVNHLRFLEPSAGEGDFLLPAAESLLKRTGSGATEELRPIVRAVEVNRASLAICRSRLETLFRKHGWKERHFAPVLDDWLVQADFLTVTLPGPFTHIAGNPPYIRLEHLPKELLAAYRARWSTLYDRADLYVAFFEKCLQHLSPEGRLGFICADRWMKNRYGGPLRKLVATRGFHLDIYVDFTSCPVFQEEVDAYPAVTVLRRGRGCVTKAAFRPEVSRASLSTLARALTGNSGDPRIRSLGSVSCSDQPWIFDEHGTMAVLRHLESRLPTLEAAGCRVGIGVATGADAVFIGKEEDLDVEPQRRLPLVTTRDIRSGKVEWGGNWVLNPFEDDGSPVDLAAYPRFRAYVERHRQAIARRNVAQKNRNAWYRTIDRIHPGLTLVPKLLIPDIKGSAHVVMEEGRLYPHHNLYYVTAETWDLRALRTVLSSRLGRAFVSAYSPGMRGGFLRFQAQYLRRIRIPRWETVDSSLRGALIASDDPDTAVRELYSLSRDAWESLAVPLS